MTVLLNNVYALDARFQVANYLRAGGKPYVETWLSVSSRSVTYVKTNQNKYQASLKVLLIFEKQGKIVTFDKYVLKSPMNDSATTPDYKFLDVQRFGLEEGSYELTVQLVDVNDSTNKAEQKIPFTLEFNKTSVSFSNVAFFSDFTPSKPESKVSKSGYDLSLTVSSLFAKQNDTIKLYSEIYGLDKQNDSVFLLTTYLETKQQQKLLENTISRRRISNKEVNVIMLNMPVNEVYSGEYNLVFEVKNRNNEVIGAYKAPITRINKKPITNEAELFRNDYANSFVDTMHMPMLYHYINCLRPIAETLERIKLDELVKNKKQLDTIRIKKFIYNFWANRNQESPSTAWKNYHEQVLICNAKFGNKVMKGYETERGRVFLQYGPPNNRTTVDNEPSAYPYDIWWYYKTKKQNNVRFVFYNPDLISNDYVLLHSEAFEEPYNPQWKMILFSRTNPINNVDQTDNRKHFGSNIDQNFQNQ